MEPEVIYIHLIESQIKRIKLELGRDQLLVLFYKGVHLIIIGLSFKRESTVFCHTISH